MDRRTFLGAAAAGGAVLMSSAAQAAAPAAAAPAIPTPAPAAPASTGDIFAEYAPRNFAFPNGLPGLSKELINDHLELYKGYVKRSNALFKELLAAEKAGTTTAAVQEQRRRLGFEFSGMRMHELFFEALAETPTAPNQSHPLHQSIIKQWGSWDAWWNSLKASCTMPGIGWGALVKDPVTGRLSNAWFQDHENGVLVGTQVILLIDVWEHAYVRDYGATGRGKYVDAIRNAINWSVVEKRA